MSDPLKKSADRKNHPVDVLKSESFGSREVCVTIFDLRRVKSVCVRLFQQNPNSTIEMFAHKTTPKTQKIFV